MVYGEQFFQAGLTRDIEWIRAFSSAGLPLEDPGVRSSRSLSKLRYRLSPVPCASGDQPKDLDSCLARIERLAPSARPNLPDILY